MNRTIKYFLEITKIYRESKYEDKMSEYLINFAKKRGLKYIKDKCGNVLITKTVDDKFKNFGLAALLIGIGCIHDYITNTNVKICEDEVNKLKKTAKAA